MSSQAEAAPTTYTVWHAGVAIYRGPDAAFAKSMFDHWAKSSRNEVEHVEEHRLAHKPKATP